MISFWYFGQDIDDLNLFHRFMTSGPSTYAIVSKGHTGRSTSDALGDLIGPTHPDIAKQENPQCLTAVYGTDEVLNGFYCSRSNQEALASVRTNWLEVAHAIPTLLERYKWSFRVINPQLSRVHHLNNMAKKKLSCVCWDPLKYERKEVCISDLRVSER